LITLDEDNFPFRLLPNAHQVIQLPTPATTIYYDGYRSVNKIRNGGYIYHVTFANGSYIYTYDDISTTTFLLSL
jgi:hypothetical protein